MSVKPAMLMIAADKIIEEKGLKQETDTGAIKAIVEEVIAKNQAMVDEYRAGKERPLTVWSDKS